MERVGTSCKRAFPLTPAEIDRYPPVQHPIVRTHPYTRRKCLYVMRGDCVGIEGVDAEEAEALIAALADHVVKPAFIYRHQWRRGDLVMWDNCSVQHRAIQDYDVTAQSEVSFDDACRTVVADAARTLRGIMSFRISEAECVVEHDRIIAYRVTRKVVFQVER
jgi:flavin-binding protein dodecin